MQKNGVKRVVFSSSATVYGVPQFLPITEEHPTGQNCTNPYGKTKYFVEEILKDVCISDPVSWQHCGLNSNIQIFSILEMESDKFALF